mgnify:CR=1 FL=1
MNEVRKIIQFSKFSVWSIVLLALLYSSCKDQVSTADFEKLEVKWKLIKNHLAESPYGECEFIFINNSGNTISSDDWTLDFNQITFFEESKGDTSIGKIVHINGYLHRFIPGSKFTIKAGDSIKYRYISPEPIIKAGYAPRGGYIVLQSKPIAIQEIQVSGFDQLENVFPDSNILSSVPTALSIYDHNAMIQGLLGSDQNCPIIPSPNKYEKTNLTFILTKETSINYSSEFENEAIYFQTFLDKHLNVKVNRNKNGSENDGNINLQFKKEIIGSESYELLINDKSIHSFYLNI